MWTHVPLVVKVLKGGKAPCVYKSIESHILQRCVQAQHTSYFTVVFAKQGCTAVHILSRNVFAIYQRRKKGIVDTLAAPQIA